MGAVRRVARAAAASAPVALALVDLVGYVARVDGASMQPALNPSGRVDYVLLARGGAAKGRVSRGDVVALVAPKEPDKRLIKRVVALPGDSVPTLGFRRPLVRVPEGHCWVEGDHTGHTLDSNSFGSVPLGLITAKAVCVVWPPSRWRFIESRSPPRKLAVIEGS